jgi:hypothetical protein
MADGSCVLKGCLLRHLGRLRPLPAVEALALSPCGGAAARIGTAATTGCDVAAKSRMHLAAGHAPKAVALPPGTRQSFSKCRGFTALETGH